MVQRYYGDVALAVATVGDDELAIADLGELLSTAVVAVDGQYGVMGRVWGHVWLRLGIECGPMGSANHYSTLVLESKERLLG